MAVCYTQFMLYLIKTRYDYLLQTGDMRKASTI